MQSTFFYIVSISGLSGAANSNTGLGKLQYQVMLKMLNMWFCTVDLKKIVICFRKIE